MEQTTFKGMLLQAKQAPVGGDTLVDRNTFAELRTRFLIIKMEAKVSTGQNTDSRNWYLLTILDESDKHQMMALSSNAGTDSVYQHIENNPGPSGPYYLRAYNTRFGTHGYALQAVPLEDLDLTDVPF